MIYDGFPWFVWFTWGNRPLPYEWARWFAWWPVCTGDGWRWLRRVDCRIHGEVAYNGELCGWAEFRPRLVTHGLKPGAPMVIAVALAAMAVVILLGLVVMYPESRFGMGGG